MPNSGAKPRLLDLFCGAGGAATGYARAGFEVVGVDQRPQPRYPYELCVDDALDVLRQLCAGWSVGPFMPSGQRYWLWDFAAIHASPPCQRYSSTASLPNVRRDLHMDLVPATRDALMKTRTLWVIENVERAPLAGARLCGLTFGLGVFRHRLFESSALLFEPEHVAHAERRIGVGGMVCVAGNGGGISSGWLKRRRYVPADHRNKAAWSRAMGIDWMTRDELAQAIPPAYTAYIGRQLFSMVG